MIIAPVNAAVDVGLAYIMAIAIEFAMAGDLRQAGKYTLIFICYILLSFFTGYFRKKTSVWHFARQCFRIANRPTQANFCTFR